MPASALSTDLYQLTMMAGYFATGRHLSTTATFELFARRLPPNRQFLIAAGLEPFLDYLERLRFTGEDVRALQREPALAKAPPDFFGYLQQFSFTGTLRAVPEGTPVFANEPLLQITAPIPQAQLVETAALAFLNFQTSVASKAARVVIAAAGRPVMEFGARRAHGLEAALFAARAAFIAGCAGTSYIEAGIRFGIPLSGTMAHSWVLSGTDELTAFKDYERLFPGHAVLLLDTYDTVAAAKLIVRAGMTPAAVRLDSGNLDALSREVRAIFDAAGLGSTRILASGDLDETSIADLVARAAPVDGFGVGTSIVTSIDAPALGGVYKLVEVEENGKIRGVMKTSPGKGTWPGKKQVWRVLQRGTAVQDIVAFETEPAPAGATPLLRVVMREGARVDPQPSLADSREWCGARLAEMPAFVRDLAGSEAYPVRPSEALKQSVESRSTT
jgi:nicotinate phosphoribosyltransferase